MNARAESDFVSHVAHAAVTHSIWARMLAQEGYVGEAQKHAAHVDGLGTAMRVLVVMADLRLQREGKA